MKNFAITGAAGYIGRHLTQYLKKTYPDCYVAGIDIADKYNSLDTFQETKIDFDAVFHLAATSSVSEGIGKPYSLFKNNIEVTNQVINTFKGKTRSLVFASSSAVYYGGNGLPFQENDDLKPFDTTEPGNSETYALSKIMCEKILSAAQHEYGFKYTASRLGNVAGKSIYDYPLSNGHLIPAIFRKPSFVFNGDPEKFIRDYVHVDDVCEAFDLAHVALLNSSYVSNAYNIASQIGYSNKEVLTKCELLLQKTILYTIGAPREETKEIILDISNAKHDLNWEPRKNIDEMIKQSR